MKLISSSIDNHEIFWRSISVFNTVLILIDLKRKTDLIFYLINFELLFEKHFNNSTFQDTLYVCVCTLKYHLYVYPTTNAVKMRWKQTCYDRIGFKVEREPVVNRKRTERGTVKVPRERCKRWTRGWKGYVLFFTVAKKTVTRMFRTRDSYRWADIDGSPSHLHSHKYPQTPPLRSFRLAAGEADSIRFAVSKFLIYLTYYQYLLTFSQGRSKVIFLGGQLVHLADWLNINI